MTELKTQEKERIILSPNIYGFADDEELIYHIEVELPGVDKENMSLKMLEDSFYIRGETENAIYVGSYAYYKIRQCWTFILFECSDGCVLGS